MLSDKVHNILSIEKNKHDLSIIDEIRDLEENGFLSQPVPQTFYKYPTTIILNHAYK